MAAYRTLTPEEIELPLFAAFQRRQVVTLCRRRKGDQWVLREDPFIDDWSAADYRALVTALKRTAAHGFVCGAFLSGALKGFVAVEGTPAGSQGQYLDLTQLHVSQDVRRQGIGRALFCRAVGFARRQNVPKLYLSAHSAVETQRFYRAMGCVDAQEPMAAHVREEPFDCQLECPVCPPGPETNSSQK